jgi:hypothetical protein
MPPSELRWKLRSETYAGVAWAMAQQWGGGDWQERPFDLC